MEVLIRGLRGAESGANLASSLPCVFGTPCNMRALHALLGAPFLQRCLHRIFSSFLFLHNPCRKFDTCSLVCLPLPPSFYNLVLLPRVREDIRLNKRLNYHLYQSLRKSLYKPDAFFKGILLPLAEVRRGTEERGWGGVGGRGGGEPRSDERLGWNNGGGPCSR